MTDSIFKSKVVTINPCKLCAPLGATLVFRGIEDAMPILHGSQGCATYIRRYLISHFKEPVDLASTGFSEATAIFGGGENLLTALENVTKQYRPRLIGVATTCLSETIGDAPDLYIKQNREEGNGEPTVPVIVTVSTPSYQGTHIDGFQAAVKGVVQHLAKKAPTGRHINLFPGLVSPADLRYLQEILADFGLDYVMLPDYSESLDGPIWEEYQKIPRGGAPIRRIVMTGSAKATLELGRTLKGRSTAGNLLWDQFNIPNHQIGTPLGVNETDRFLELLQKLSGKPVPGKYRLERGRLIDSYVDGHKYVFGKKAVVYGDEDLVTGLVAFLTEIGITPVFCASGAESGRLAESIHAVAPEISSSIIIAEGMDFDEIMKFARELAPDLLIGNSKGYALSRKLGIPLVRVGFPIHDRIGGQRILHLGYRGAQQLFDRIVNTLIERKQNTSPVGYSYM